jgi:osmotically-inducible protein OsmY
LYDLVLNLERTDLGFISEMVIHAVRQPQFQITPQSARDMGDLLLASRVRAALAGIANLRLDRLAVKANGELVTIRGRVRSQELLDEVLATAGQAPGVASVNSELQIDYRSYGVE